MSNLVKRILFGVVAIPVTLGVMILSPRGSLALCTVLFLIGLREYFGLFADTFRGYVFLKALGYAVCLLLLISSYFQPGFTPSEYFHWWQAGAVAVFLLLAGAELSGGDLAGAPRRTGLWLLGVFYCGFMASFVYNVYLIQIPHSQISFLLLVLAGIWGSDSLAYFVGKFWGSVKISPLISPNKTWEGCFAGLGGSLIFVLLGRFFLFPELNLFHVFNLGLLIGVVGQAGDFWESMLKRAAGKKDSSNLFPGHGGVLDRLDSLLFTAPAVYYYMFFWKLL